MCLAIYYVSFWLDSCWVGLCSVSGLGDLQSVDAQLLAAGGDVLGSQHGGVRGRLVAVGLDLHTTGDSGNGLAATGITQNVSLSRAI